MRMHFPGSLAVSSRGMRRSVAEVSSWMRVSVSVLPSQCAQTNPPWLICSLNDA